MKVNKHLFNWKNVESQRAHESYLSQFVIGERFIKDVDSLVRGFNIQPNYSLLDFGCGDGKHVIELHRRGYNVCGYDISSYYIDKAKKIAENNAEEVNFYNNINSLQLLSKKFDLIYTIHFPISYIDDNDILSTFKGIHGLLKESGTFLFNFPYTRENREKQGPENQWKIDDGKYYLTSLTIDSLGVKEEKYIVIDPETDTVDEWTDTCKYFYLDEMIKMLTDCGFEILYCCEDLSAEPIEDKTEITSIYCRRV